MSLTVISQLSPEQIKQLHQLYQITWWGKNRTINDIERMLEHSDLIVGICANQTQKLLGFARILTDYVYRAVLWDVIVDPNYQGQGLGKKLVETIIAHPELKQVETILLICLPDMVSFYEKFGFTTHDNKLALMTLSGNWSEQI